MCFFVPGHDSELVVGTREYTRLCVITVIRLESNKQGTTEIFGIKSDNQSIESNTNRPHK